MPETTNNKTLDTCFFLKSTTASTPKIHAITNLIIHSIL